jgi:RHS repeat-associated protein
LIIRHSQLEAFKIPVRKKNRENMILQLIAKGYNAVDEKNRDIAIVDSKGNKTRLVFNENYQPRKIIKPSGLEYEFEFDKDDNISKLIFPGNEAVEMRYENELLKSLTLNHNLISLHYDDKKRLTQIVSPDGKCNKITYNINNQIETLTNRANETTRYSTSINQDRLHYALRDSIGRHTKFETDPKSSDNRIIFADDSQESNSYDENIDVVLSTLRNDSKRYTYHNAGQPFRQEWEDDNYLELYHDDYGRVSKLENPNGQVNYEFDDKNQIIEESFLENKVSYIYDEDGLLTELIYPSGLSIKYEYDEDGRLSKIDTNGNTCTYTFGSNDTVTSIVYSNGLKENRAQEIIEGIKEINITALSGEIIVSSNYEYDNLNRLSRYRSIDKNRPQKQKEWSLIYDDGDRLLKNHELISGSIESFQYDHKGNFSSINSTKVTVGLMDEILSIGESELLYDKSGNIKCFTDANGDTITLNFNNDNQLINSTKNNISTYYWYDPLGRRICKTDEKTSFLYYWSGEKLIAEKYIHNNKEVLREYIYPPNELIPIGFKENDKFFWMHIDVRGAITHVTNDKGKFVWSATYDSFGNADIHINEVRQPFRLMGQYNDSESGLNYSIGRYYSPQLKSYLSMDPLWFEFGATNYSYCNNDPFNKADTSGRLWHILGAAAVGAVVGGVMGGLSEGTLNGALKGAGKGALTGAAAATGGFLGFAAASAAIAFTESVYNQVKSASKICVPCILWKATSDAALDLGMNMLTAGIAKYVNLRIMQALGKKVRVTSWADAHVKKENIQLNSGKWVMLGPKTKGSHLMTGTVGFKVDSFKEVFMPWRWKKVSTPFDNSASDLIPASQIGLPQNVGKVEKMKAFLFQQYMIK